MSRSSSEVGRRRGRGWNVVLALVVGVGAIGLVAVVASPDRSATGTIPSSESAREADHYFVAGLAAYRQQDWRRAIAGFEAALSFDEHHVDAREHLDLARSEDRNQQTLERAGRALDDGRTGEASALATTIPASSVYFERAREIRRRAQAARGE